MTFENQVTIQIESTDLTVAPGSSVNVPLSLQNHSPVDGFFEITVAGIPSNWVSMPSPAFRLAAGEQRQVLLTIQPPPPPQGRAGRHQVVIRVVSQETPQQAAEAACTLTVAGLQVPGRIGILLTATEFSVAPGESVTFPLVLLNQGLEGDMVSLSVDGVPSSWVSASSPSISLSPGQQQEVTLTIRPTPSGESGAGQHPFKVLVTSQANPGQVAVAECVLVVASFSRFSSELHPQRSEARAPARVTVENQGNVEQLFTLTWQSPDDGLDFEPLSTQQLHVPPGQVAMAEFSARPRSRPLFGGDSVLPFTTHVQAAGVGVQNLNGEIVSKALIPTWVPIAVLALLLACACLSVMGVGVLGILDQTQPAAPAATAAPVEGQPPEPLATEQLPAEQPAAPAATAAPVEPPAEEQPVEPPAEEQPVEPPPEQPAEPPAGEQPPVGEQPPSAEQLPAGQGESGLPCAPAAGGLLLAPLLVMGKKHGIRRRSNK